MRQPRFTASGSVGICRASTSRQMQPHRGDRPRIICASEEMTRVIELARRAGESDAKVLITGESGVGKDLLARETHFSSPRRNRSFVAVNCAGFSESLLE